MLIKWIHNNFIYCSELTPGKPEYNKLSLILTKRNVCTHSFILKSECYLFFFLIPSYSLSQCFPSFQSIPFLRLLMCVLWWWAIFSIFLKLFLCVIFILFYLALFTVYTHAQLMCIYIHLLKFLIIWYICFTFSFGFHSQFEISKHLVKTALNIRSNRQSGRISSSWRMFIYKHLKCVILIWWNFELVFRMIKIRDFFWWKWLITIKLTPWKFASIDIVK